MRISFKLIALAHVGSVLSSGIDRLLFVEPGASTVFLSIGWSPSSDKFQIVLIERVHMHNYYYYPVTI